MNGDLISRYALRKSVTDELERISCVYYKYNEYYSATKKAFNTVLEFIDHAPTVEFPEQITMKFDCDTEEGKQKLLSLIANAKVGWLVESEKPQGEFSRKDLESWLYQIAMNNIGTDFEKSVVEIIHRLDGFERFVSEQKGGAE